MGKVRAVYHLWVTNTAVAAPRVGIYLMQVCSGEDNKELVVPITHLKPVRGFSLTG